MTAPGTPGEPLMLAIDTAGSACSVALGDGEVLIAHRRRDMRHGHGEALLLMIDEMMVAAGVAPAAIGAVAAAVGPGGFTGIRVGLAAAHGIAIAVGARLIGVTGFAAVAALSARGVALPLLVALDSRRADLYVQLFDATGKPGAAAMAVLPDDLATYLRDAGHSGPLAIAGDATAVAAGALAGLADVRILPHSEPDAAGVLAAARRDTETAPHPLYLRPPDVTLPRQAAGTTPAR